MIIWFIELSSNINGSRSFKIHASEYSKYVEVKGIKLATKSIEKFDDGGLWGKFEYTTDIDVDYREDLFDKPPSIADGPNGWRKKAK